MKNYTDFICEVTKKKVAVLTFGRFNPPTIGHVKLVDAVLRVAKKEKATPFIYLSHTQDAKRNPLSHRDKVKYLGMSAPEAKRYIKGKSKAKTIFDAIEEINDSGFTNLIIVVGDDRVTEFESLISRYIDDYSNLRDFKVVSAGQRDPDASGVEGMSASKAREFAVSGDYKKFAKSVSKSVSDRFKKQMYDEIRAGLNIRD